MPDLELAPSQQQLEAGRQSLLDNTYPGRIAIMGLSSGGDLAFQAYAIMGRSEGSRNRIFVQEGSSIRTVAPNKTPEEMAETEMAALIYYRALAAGEEIHVVSNGAQTDPVIEMMSNVETELSLEEALRAAPTVEGVDLSMYEPDGDNNTPRITGVIDFWDSAKTPFGLAVVRKDPETAEPIYSVYEAQGGVTKLALGVGYGVQTYNGNGNPLPSFDREPFAFPMGEDTIDTAHAIWDVLDPYNAVSLVVRAIDIESKRAAGTTIINERL